MWKKLGDLVKQIDGYKAFIPLPFPPSLEYHLSPEMEIKLGEAMRQIGRLDGITQLIPDKDFFLLMFVRKEAASSSQIEGTRATLIDVIEADVSTKYVQARDVDDIIHYIKALNFGLKRFESIPFSVRLIREIHNELMTGALSTHHSYPGEFRKSQNWIGGTNPGNASYVPPPPGEEMNRAISDLEKFIHNRDVNMPPLIKAALLHAQFETIHPFTDGNGRTGRLLVTLFLWKEKLLELPLLYLSDYFKQHQKLYYDNLQRYHSNPSDMDSWISFFLDGIIETANSAIQVASEINRLREEDFAKVHRLGKVAASTAVTILRNLYRQPIVDVTVIEKWVKTSRSGAYNHIKRMVNMGILTKRNLPYTNRISYEYTKYLRLFYR